MRRSTGALYLLAVMMVASACSGADDDTTASSTARSSLAPAVTASISTVPSTTSTSTTTVAATTTTTVASTTTVGASAPTTTEDTSNLPLCSELKSPGRCIGVTVPLPPDAEVILARYREFATKHLEVQSDPDSPDWDGLLAFVIPSRRSEARAEIEERFKRGEVLNVSLGVTLAPIIDRSQYPDGFIRLLDCRVDGSYWVDRATNVAIAGEVPEVRRRAFAVAMDRVDGTWMLSGYRYAEGNC